MTVEQNHGIGRLPFEAPASETEVVDNLQALGVAVLFVVGSDGTLRGARIAVVGVLKTIDNDIHSTDLRERLRRRARRHGQEWQRAFEKT